MSNLSLHTRIGGDGPPVTLLHGFTTHGAAWDAVRPRLEQRFRVLTIDLPGHGGSPSPPPGYDFAACVDDLLATMRRMQQAPGALVGYSMGGRIALAMALREPQLLTRLVLESASPGLADESERAAREAADAALANEIEGSELADFIDRWLSAPLFRTQRLLDEATRRRSRAIRLDNQPIALAAALRCLGTGSQPSYWDALSTIEHPILLVTGEHDEKFHRIADEMHRRLPASRRAVVSAAGHATHLEQPDEFLERVTHFLADDLAADLAAVAADPPATP